MQRLRISPRIYLLGSTYWPGGRGCLGKIFKTSDGQHSQRQLHICTGLLHKCVCTRTCSLSPTKYVPKHEHAILAFLHHRTVKLFAVSMQPSRADYNLESKDCSWKASLHTYELCDPGHLTSLASLGLSFLICKIESTSLL